MLVLDIIFAANGDYIDSISFCVGRPNNSRILYIWFNVEFPGNIDFPLINKPKMHKTDHISTAFSYFVDPNKI